MGNDDEAREPAMAENRRRSEAMVAGQRTSRWGRRRQDDDGEDGDPEE